MSDLFLSVGLCVYNKEQSIPQALESLINQTLEKELFEIVVVDNNSTDNTPFVVKKFIEDHPEFNIKYFKEMNQGVSYARNRCYEEASGDYIVYFDDDEIAFTDWLKNYYQAIKKYPDASIFAGKVIVRYDDQEFAKIADEYVDNWFGSYQYGEEEINITPELIEKKEIDYPLTGNLAVKIDYIKKAGGFDTNLGRSKNSMFGGEDTKFVKDAINSGVKIVYIPGSAIYHIVIKERCSVEFLKMKHLQQGMTFIKIHFESASLFKRFKIILYNLLFITARSAKFVFSSKKQKNIISMKNSFSKGIIKQCMSR